MKTRALMLAVLATAFSGTADERTFTNSEGRQIRAELIEVSDDKATLKMDGRNFEVPVSSLSDEDQKYIDVWKKEHSDKAASSGNPNIKPNWTGEWPKIISADISQDIEVIKEDESTSEYIYASDHYEFICDVKLNTSVVKRFSLLFEATNLYMRELPLGMVKPFREERHKIHLFELASSYFEKGGPPGSAGVYISRGGEGDILVPLRSLGVKKVGSSYSVDYDEENTTLSHEIAHQITDYEYYAPGSRGWFTEGLAEYIAQSGYRSGKFNVNDLSKLKDFVTAYGEDGSGGRALGEDINSPALEDFFNQSYESFTANANFNYGMGALVVYYFFHMDGEKDGARIKAFLKGLKSGNNEAPKMFEPLLDGRSFDDLEAEITKNWRARGIRINFP